MERSLIPRRETRRPVRMTARCRTVSGLKDDGFVSDISAAGCCVSMRTLFVSVGMRVLIKPQGMEGLTGIVRWIEGNRAGVLFDAPLYGPVVEHLADMHRSGRPVSVSQY